MLYVDDMCVPLQPPERGLIVVPNTDSGRVQALIWDPSDWTGRPLRSSDGLQIEFGATKRSFLGIRVLFGRPHMFCTIAQAVLRACIQTETEGNSRSTSSLRSGRCKWPCTPLSAFRTLKALASQRCIADTLPERFRDASCALEATRSAHFRLTSFD